MYFRSSPLLSLTLGLACLMGLNSASAEKADRQKPMFIESDALRVDDLKQVSVATGKVIVTKGAIDKLKEMYA